MFSATLKTLAIASALALLAVSGGTAQAAPIPAGNTGWTWANPLPQGNSITRADEAGGRVWAAGAAGTLIFSDDGGTSWSGARTGLLDDIRALDAISPTSVVFGGSCALRRSDDGGATVRRLPWSASDDSCLAKIVTVSFPDPLIGYLLLDNGDVYATADGGGSWKKQGVAPQSVSVGGTSSVYDMHFTTPQKGVLSVGDKVAYSNDAGVNWTPVKSAPTGPGAYMFGFAGSEIGFAAGDHSDLLKTTDGGATWEAVVSDGVINTRKVTKLSCANAQTCVASPADGALLRTPDGGEHWTTISPAWSTAATLFPAGQGVAFGGHAIGTTTDFGASWWMHDPSVTGANAVSGDFSDIRVESKKAALAFGIAGAFAYSSTGGARWRNVTAPFAGATADAASVSKHFVAVGTSGRIAHSSDRGQSWKKVPSLASVKPRALILWKGGRTVLIGARGLRVSNAWGARAHLVRGPLARFKADRADRAGDAAFAYGASGIMMTTDRARSWKRVRTPRGAKSIVKLDMLNARTGYLLDSNAELFKTTSGGRRWNRVETTGANTAVSIAFGDSKHGYIGDATGRILATADGGATWSRQYPFFDTTAKSALSIVGVSKLRAVALVKGTDHIFSTKTGGRIGRSSRLTITPSASKVRRGTVVPVTGKLSPATGVERVAVLARIVGAKGGIEWVTQNVTVSASGTFTTKWKVTAPTVFIARWSGDASHDGDAAPRKIVRLR